MNLAEAQAAKVKLEQDIAAIPVNFSRETGALTPRFGPMRLITWLTPTCVCDSITMPAGADRGTYLIPVFLK